MPRVTFVVGKGGVGKTTTAVELALQSARSGQSTYLISTDPAHSLRDVLAEAVASLQIEEFDARAYSDAWLGRARSALLQVVERGTYLDSEDAKSFLDLSLPGVDEVMAALRLVELTELTVERVVVDTAPTGHTLRLLDAADVIESWADALEAMIEKADAVSIGLLGRAPEWPAVALLRDWRARASAFRGLLRSAEFVVVTRAEPVVAAETERLLRELAQRGLRLSETRVIRPPAASAPRAPNSNEIVQWLRTATPGLLLVAGKGGVGKTTCAAAIALAKAGVKDLCLISTDPAGSLSDVFAQEVTPEPREVHPGLRAWQLDARARYDQLRARYASEVHRVFENLGLSEAAALDKRVIDRFWNLAPPGIDEIVALVELLNVTDLCASLVIDSAPTGHFLRLMEMPRIAVDWAHALLRLLLKYRAAGSMENFSREVLDLARDARALREQLTDTKRAAVVLVTLDEPVVSAETRRLQTRLAKARIPVAAIVVNRAHAEPAPLAGQSRTIRAPLLDAPPTGVQQLQDFLTQWEFMS